jgi:hypothetical protein
MLKAQEILVKLNWAGYWKRSPILVMKLLSVGEQELKTKCCKTVEKD